MSDKSAVSFSLPAGFFSPVAWAIFFSLFALTGNCHCGGCGFDRDYVQMWSQP